jgi:hypothetical protein
MELLSRTSAHRCLYVTVGNRGQSLECSPRSTIGDPHGTEPKPTLEVCCPPGGLTRRRVRLATRPASNAAPDGYNVKPFGAP